MSELENLGDNPAEPVPDVATAAEPGQPVEPELEPISSEPQEGTSSSGNNQDHEVEELLRREPIVSVKFAVSDDNEAGDENLEGESLLEIDKALHFYETLHPSIHFLKSLNNEKQIHKKFFDKFAQTFFKFMKNLSDRRFIEIIRQEVDHEDKSLVFYCSSSKLLLTFQS